MMVKTRRPKRTGATVLTQGRLEAYASYGAQLPDGRWKLFLAGVAYQSPDVYNRRQQLLIRFLGNAMQATPEQIQGDLFQARVAPFLAEADHNRRVVVEIGGETFGLRKTTRRNGHFRGWLQLDERLVERAVQTDERGRQQLPFRVWLEATPSLSVAGNLQLLPAGGVSVISDIDDTIKISGVGDRKKLLANTFLRSFRGVDGMADLYQAWSAAGASFHYVSSSPWQLYRPLLGLHSELRFPVGTMHLRNFRLRDQLFKKLLLRRHGKVAAIRSLMRALPQREFVLIGDSGEKDPEIYRKICRRFPNRIRGLLIRDLPHRAMTEERWRKLRDVLPAGVCEGFSDGATLQRLTEQLFD